MAYPENLQEILMLMGYENEVDFEVSYGGSPYLTFIWNAGSPDKPTDTEVNDFYTAYLAHPDRLVEKKSVAKSEVDVAAVNARARYITSGTGQELTYLRKEEDAEAFKTASYPVSGSPEVPAGGSPTPHVWILAEVKATGKTPQQAADDILTQRDVWLTVGVQIEEERIKGKTNIDAAADETGVNTARDNAINTLNSI